MEQDRCQNAWGSCSSATTGKSEGHAHEKADDCHRKNYVHRVRRDGQVKEAEPAVGHRQPGEHLLKNGRRLWKLPLVSERWCKVIHGTESVVIVVA